MKKSEAHWQTIWNQYVREKNLYGYFELKYTDKDSMPFNAVKDHQRLGLLASEANGFVWKLSDADMREKPFDSFNAKPAPAYVVIKFPGGFYVINIKVFLAEESISEKKSIHIDRAKELSHIVVRC